MASSSKQPLLLEATAASEATGWRRGQDLIDALPYIDTLNDRQKKEVEALLEMQVFFVVDGAHTLHLQQHNPLASQMVTSPKTPADYLNELPPLPKSVLDVRCVPLHRHTQAQAPTTTLCPRHLHHPHATPLRITHCSWQSWSE